MIHHIFANRSNIGDWLSARGIQSLLAGLPLTEHLCDEPFVEDTLARLATAGPDDGIVIGGGGLFMDYFTPFWEGFVPVAERVPFCIWGVGCVDLKDEPSHAPRELLAPIVRQSRLCVVRDELTRRFLDVAHLPPSVPCPSLAAVQLAPLTGRGLLHAANYTTVGAPVYEAMRIHGTAFAHATDRPYRETDNTIPAGSEAALAAALALYAGADLVLSSRLHGCLIALAMGRPVLAVSGDYKVEAFMESVGLSDWVCGQDAVDSIPERLESLHEQPAMDVALAAVRTDQRAIAQTVRHALPPQPARLASA